MLRVDYIWLDCCSAAVFSTVLLGLMALLEKPVGPITLLLLLQLAVAQTIAARRRTLPAVSKLTGHIRSTTETTKTIKSKTLDSLV